MNSAPLGVNMPQHDKTVVSKALNDAFLNFIETKDPKSRDELIRKIDAATPEQLNHTFFTRSDASTPNHNGIQQLLMTITDVNTPEIETISPAIVKALETTKEEQIYLIAKTLLHEKVQTIFLEEESRLEQLIKKYKENPASYPQIETLLKQIIEKITANNNNIELLANTILSENPPQAVYHAFFNKLAELDSTALNFIPTDSLKKLRSSFDQYLTEIPFATAKKIHDNTSSITMLMQKLDGIKTMGLFTPRPCLSILLKRLTESENPKKCY